MLLGMELFLLVRHTHTHTLALKMKMDDIRTHAQKTHVCAKTQAWTQKRAHTGERGEPTHGTPGGDRFTAGK